MGSQYQRQRTLPVPSHLPSLIRKIEQLCLAGEIRKDVLCDIRMQCSPAIVSVNASCHITEHNSLSRNGQLQMPSKHSVQGNLFFAGTVCERCMHASISITRWSSDLTCQLSPASAVIVGASPSFPGALSPIQATHRGSLHVYGALDLIQCH